MDDPTIYSWFLDHGILGILVLAVGWSARVVFKRLFDENKGIVTKVANRHMLFVDSLDKSQQDVSESIRANVAAEEKTHRVVGMHADALLSMAAATSKEVKHAVKPHIEAIRRELGQ